jgi:tRNA1(Val) A37 N6-methylase TrmN6
VSTRQHSSGNLTLDRICGVLEVYQAGAGYRFGMEALFLCGFARGPVERLVDLGTGSGIIPLVLARFGKARHAVGIEIQEGLADRARRSVKRNGLVGKIEILKADLRELKGVLPAGRFELVTCNPPYGKAGAGQLSPDNERALARHEILCTLSDAVAAAARLLAPRGRLAMVFPPARLPEAIALCAENGLRPTRLRLIQGRTSLPPKNVLLEATRGTRARLEIEPSLIIYGEDGEYTRDAKEMLYPAGNGFG